MTVKKKVLVICLAGVRSLLRPEKKSSCCLSGGCMIVITTEKKKVLVVCLAGCAVVSVFGSGGKKVLVVHTTMYLEYHTVVVLC